MNKFFLLLVGEPNSISSEIIFKSWNKISNKNLKPILIGNKNILKKQMLTLGYKFFFKNINKKNFLNDEKKNIIPIINIKFKQKKSFDVISGKSNKFINDSFNTALNLSKNKNCIGIINCPIKKETFLKSKFKGITELISHKLNSLNKEVMLIYNKKISVCPITTHESIKNVPKNITTKKIINKVRTINNFYKKKLNKNIKFAITGLNPHCYSGNTVSEEQKKIIPAINFLKKNNIFIDGPFSADSFFTKNNIKKYDVLIGMYHDQVLTPIKALFGFDSINITLGLPILRISPDHGVGEDITGKNKSNNKSLIMAYKFFKTLND